MTGRTEPASTSSVRAERLSAFALAANGLIRPVPKGDDASPAAYRPNGPNHVLPTARSARFSSGLSVLDFMKRTTLAKMTPEALRKIGPAAERLAISESLQAHGLSVRARLDKLNAAD